MKKLHIWNMLNPKTTVTPETPVAPGTAPGIDPQTGAAPSPAPDAVGTPAAKGGEAAGWTRLVFILDRSGSMHGREEDTIGGYNRLLEAQKALPGEARVTTVLFDDRYELLCGDVPLEKTQPLDGSTYFVRGSTALLDAVGRTVADLRARDRAGDRPARTVVAITTDGLENASREYRFETVREMIRAQEGAGWEFLFLGANIDAAAEARRIGIRADRAANFSADAEGIAESYEAVSCAMASVRANRDMGTKWKKKLEER